MRLLSILSECKECHFTVGEELFLTPEARLYFPSLPRTLPKLREYDGFNKFDLFFVECLMRREVFQEAFYVRMIELAKDLQTIYNDVHQEISWDCDREDLRRREVIEKNPNMKDDVHPMTLPERREMFDMQNEKMLRPRLRLLTAKAEDVAEMRLELYERIMKYDNYAKARRILFKLSADDRADLAANATGETRYAHILYAIDAYLVQYLSFVLKKPVSGILSGDPLGLPSRYSLCPHCGDRMVDVGRQRRKCCDKPECHKKYERMRKQEQRKKKRMSQ